MPFPSPCGGVRVEALMLFPDAVQRGAHKGVYALKGYVLRCAREKCSGGAQGEVSRRAHWICHMR